MKLDTVTDAETRGIIDELESGKSRNKSRDYLDGFPWRSVVWHRAELEYCDLENLFLFWDGSAWGESPCKSPRTLKAGVTNFMRINNDLGQSNNVHLNQIKVLLESFAAGNFRSGKPYLIAVGLEKSSRFMVLDGNHRITAALWWSIQSGDRSQLPGVSWLGLSSDMDNYKYYRRIL